jgi:hypothetical protein
MIWWTGAKALDHSMLNASLEAPARGTTPEVIDALLEHLFLSRGHIDRQLEPDAAPWPSCQPTVVQPIWLSPLPK